MSNPNPSLPSNNAGIVLNLLRFDKTVSLDECGLLYNEVYNPQFNEYDAIANVNVDLKTFKNMFCFQSDYIDVNDVPSTDIKYYVLNSKTPYFIPSLGSSIVGTNPIVLFDSSGTSETNQLVGKDFTRYLASLLFNTPYGTDLFINESALVNSVSSALYNTWVSCLTDLRNVSNESTDTTIPLVGTSPKKYLTNDFSGVQNICRELFLQLISKSPSRFTDLPQIPVEDEWATPIREGSNLNYYYLPFVNNDIVQLRVKVYPCAEQPTFGLSSTTDPTKFETVNNNTHLKGRTYLINMVLSDNATATSLLIGKCSIKVVGKNATLSTLDYLPIIQNNNIMNITQINTAINANTIQSDIYYEVNLAHATILNPSILDVGIGFSTNAITYYNANIQSIEIMQFGGIPLYGRGSQFKSLTSNIIFSATDVPLISPNTSLDYAFASMPNFNVNVGFLNMWNLLNVSSMNNMFSSCATFNNGSTTNNGLNPLSLTTSSTLTSMSGLLQLCPKFNQLVSISNMTQVSDMSFMFNGCSIFNNGSVSNDGLNPITLNTSSSLLNISSLFNVCSVFNQRVSISNLTNATNISSMFRSCSIFNNGNTSDTATNPITFITSPSLLNASNLFWSCSKFNQTVSITNTSNLQLINSIFYNCTIFNNGSLSDDGANPITLTTSSSLTTTRSFVVGCPKFNQTVSITNMSGVTDTTSMFYNAHIFNNGNTGDYATKPMTFNTSSLLTAVNMFNGCYKLNQTISIDTSSATSMLGSFSNCRIFNNGSLSDDGAHPMTLTTSSALIDASQLFSGCYKFNQTVSISTMTNVSFLNHMFMGCYIFNNGSVNDDGTRPMTFNTPASLQNISVMFHSCHKFNQTITIGDQTPDSTGIVWNINIPNVTSISSLFYDAVKFNNGNTSNIATKPMRFNTSAALTTVNQLLWSQSSPNTKFNQEIIFKDLTGVIKLELFISNCSVFNNGDVSGNATGQKPLSLTTSSKLTSLGICFGALPAFNQTVTISVISNVTNLDRMFDGCTIFNNGHPSTNTSNRLFSTNAKPTTITTASAFPLVAYPFASSILRNGNLPSWITYNTTTNRFLIV